MLDTKVILRDIFNVYLAINMLSNMQIIKHASVKIPVNSEIFARILFASNNVK